MRTPAERPHGRRHYKWWALNSHHVVTQEHTFVLRAFGLLSQILPEIRFGKIDEDTLEYLMDVANTAAEADEVQDGGSRSLVEALAMSSSHTSSASGTQSSTLCNCNDATTNSHTCIGIVNVTIVVLLRRQPTRVRVFVNVYVGVFVWGWVCECGRGCVCVRECVRVHVCV